MVLFRSIAISLLATAALAATPVRDLSTDSIGDSHCSTPYMHVDDDLDGVMVLYRGQKLSEWRNPTSQDQSWWGVNFKEGTTQHVMNSVTKTWISVLVGMLYRDGFLDWETEHPDKLTLGDIFPDEGVWNEVWNIPYPFHGSSKVPELKTITLGALMSMRTGYSETILGSPWDSNLVRDLDGLVAWWHPMYRAGVIDGQDCFHCGDYLSTTGIVNYIIKEKTKTASNPKGWDPLDYARQTTATLPNGNVGLFEALGMEEGSYSWDRDTDGVAKAAYGLWVDLEDMARFGQLLNQGGKTIFGNMEKEIIPALYLQEMTQTQSRMSSSDSPMGWQVWNWGADDDGDSGFCAEGLGWQSICVFPKQEMVIAIQASLSWSLDSFFANIKVRQDAVKKIRDGITCSPTPAPSQPNIGNPTSPNPAPPLPPADGNNNDNANGDSNNNIGNDSQNGNNNGDVNDGDSSQANLFEKKGGDDDETPVGLIVVLVLALLTICILAALLFFRKRNKKEEATANGRSVDAFCKVIPPGDAFADGNKFNDVDLDDNASKDSVDTEDSDGVTYYVEGQDIEQSSTRK